MSTESVNTKYTLNDRQNSLRQLARKYREIYDKDYPEPVKYYSDDYEHKPIDFNMLHLL
jgi:hypothetical protein